jgi:hypothetical protein
MATGASTPQRGLTDAQERQRRKTRLAKLESDMAYFQARLEILGEPKTANQEAQRKAFKLLHNTLTAMVVRERRRLLEQG